VVDHDAFETMEALMDAVGSSIGLTAEDYYEQAREMYQYLGRSGHHIDLLRGARPETYSATEEELAAWNEDNYVRSYGIDASTTQERDFSNGLRITVANAKAGVIGDGHHPIGDASHIVAGVFDRDSETGLETERFAEDKQVRADLRVLTDDDPYRSYRLLKSIVRSLSEGRHLKRVIEMADAADKEGPVFVDGPIYPPMVFPELIARHYAGNDDAWTDVFGETVGNYIDAATWSLDTHWPIIGIVKDMDSSSLVSAMTKKAGSLGVDAEVPWSKDKHFLTDLLQTDDLGTYVYTDWFVENARYSQVTDDDGNEYVEAFDGSPHTEGDLERYHRAFFYVHNPKTNTIMRVETPRGLVADDASREFIQRRALAEIAKTGESAEAILRADAEARISRQNQERLFGKLYGNMRAITSYNRDHRGPEYLGEDN
jgi:hypothetical protein